MKMLKSLLIVLMTVLTVNSFSQTVHTFNYTDNGMTFTCNSGDTVLFYNNSGVNVYAISVDGGSPITGVTSNGSFATYKYVVPVTASMTHTLVMATAGGNSTSYWNVTSITTGISSHSSLETNIRVFPNPVIDFLNITTPIDATLKLYNINGQLVMTEKVTEGDNKIFVENLASGIYIATVNSKVVKLVKP
jgi:hypothetical protein